MHCPSCSADLAQPAKFCPECGASLTAPTGPVAQPPASGAPDQTVVPHPTVMAPVAPVTEPGDLQPVPGTGTPQGPPAVHPTGATDPTATPPEAPAQVVDPTAPPPGAQPGHTDNVVQLRPDVTTPVVPGGVHVDQQTGAYGVGQPAPVHEHPAAQHVPVPVPNAAPGMDVRGRPLEVGDFFSDGAPSMEWDGDFGVEDRGEPRLLGGLVATCAIGLLVMAFVIYGVELANGAGGAEAGGFVLVAAIIWIWYLSLPPAQQHDSLLGVHQGLTRMIDRRVSPLRQRTDAQLAMRRERDRLRAIRDERNRRVNDLGEAAYRRFRTGAGDPELGAKSQRVLAIDQQMLLQEARIADMQERATLEREDRATAGAPPAAGSGDPTVTAEPPQRARPAGVGKAGSKKKRRRPSNR